jgi:ATP-dependent Lon protease
MINSKSDNSNNKKTDAKKSKITQLAESLLSGKKVIFEKKNMTQQETKKARTGIAASGSEAAKKTTTVTKTVTRQLPANQLIIPVVPLRGAVAFPHTETVLTFGRDQSIKAVQAASKANGMVALVSQKKVTVDNPGPSDLYQVATLANIDRTLKTDTQVNTLVSNIGRVKIVRFIRTKPYMLAQVIKLQEDLEKDEELTAMSVHLQREFRKAVQMGKTVEFLNFMKLMSGVNEGELTDQIASTLSAKTSYKQSILEELNVKKRMSMVIEQLSHEMKVLEIEKDVANKTQAKFDKYMRENVLRERLKTIQKELGDIDDEEELANDYDKKLKKLKAPQEVKKKIAKELKKLQQLSPNNPETGYIRSWIETMFELPWSKTSKGNFDIGKAKKILEKSHHGLPKVKDRILEYIAVLQLKAAQKNVKNKADKTVPTILCFVGPPGVGKTSIGKSVANALGREFTKISLGGVRDEAEIRGHRRTYVGAMPGRIIAGLKQAETKNPVFMLDEIDKLGNDFRGDPSAALLEALDPEQNDSFEDHYLDVPFDLSQVLFITTANTLDTIPPALRDRLEIIRYAGYTQEEKFKIVKNFLVKKQLKANGLDKKQFSISDTLLKKVISRYTREAGVRNLERKVGTLMRKVARILVENSKKKSVKMTGKKMAEFLGPEPFDETLTEKEDTIGLATGLAWTSVGGEVLFVEVALTPGKGHIKLTGKLGDVMKESAQAALTYVKANAAKYTIDTKKLEKTDIHVHVPEGAVPKDGPSAGITITTAIISALTNRSIKREVAMTGEVTLRGRVLRIGGLKEKSIAAHRAGSKIVLIPTDNERDLVDVPDSVKAEITFKPVATMDQVLALALNNDA